jgi:RNA polymerase sigma-70 factor (ECF subfamily)
MGMLLQQPTSTPLRVVRQAEEHDFEARCVAGDRAALRELFERERVRVHALIFRVVGSNAHIDDLLQDAFLEIFRSLPGFRGESSLRTWIDRCAVRVAYAHFGRKSRQPFLESVQDTPARAPSAEERSALREAARHLYAELERLEPKQRLAFTLFAIEDRPLSEVAELMDASVVSTKVRVWRARRTIEKRAKNDPLLREFLADDAVEKKDASKCEDP